jgi:hypothetical protein
MFVWKYSHPQRAFILDNYKALDSCYHIHRTLEVLLPPMMLRFQCSRKAWRANTEIAHMQSTLNPSVGKKCMQPFIDTFH